MTICFKNKSFSCVDIYIDESHIILPCNQSHIYTCAFDAMPVEIKFSIVGEKSFSTEDTAYFLNISTIILCDFDHLSSATINIEKKSNRFQNYITYQYLIINSPNSSIHDIKHVVDNYEGIKVTKANAYKYKKKHILYIIKKSFIDMLLEGLLLGVLLAWIFSLKVAIGVLFAIFSIALIVNSVKHRTAKSKYRILNWDKDMDLPDDIEYFITHIDKYCS